MVDEGDKPESKGYYILQLNYSNHRLSIHQFKPSEFERASLFYDALEKSNINRKIDTVLVRAKSLSMVKEAYPNYFLDIGEFVDIVSDYLGKPC